MSSINFDPITAAETEMGTRPRVEPTAPPEQETPKIYTFDPTASAAEGVAKFSIRPLAEKMTLADNESVDQIDSPNVVLAVQLGDLPRHDHPIIRLRYVHIEGWHPVEVVTKIIDDAVLAQVTTVHTVEFKAPLVIDMVGVESRHAYALYAELAEEFVRCKFMAPQGVYVYINDVAIPGSFSRRARDASRVYRSFTSDQRWVDEVTGSLLSGECVLDLIDGLLHDRVLLEQQARQDAATIAELRERLTPSSPTGVVETDAFTPEEDAALVAELNQMGLEMDQMESRYGSGIPPVTAEPEPSTEDDFEKPADAGKSRLIHTEEQLAEALKAVEAMKQEKERMAALMSGLERKVQELSQQVYIGQQTTGG